MEKNAFIDVQHFVAVAQTGSFTAATLALGMTGSALSKSVMRLEARLGSKLLHRTTRRISLTPEGAPISRAASAPWRYWQTLKAV
ncbi:helix-turn-helix domain-containing protein [Dyella nitratireducens]|uniref:HTH lysR-type domain-containing protein n=1 Tax=Dyella nitratireducens TaxID=1849580 RepID=A0ABQ1FX12_9GAMM|nr:LysR family transcriptional regulator [Dyella nitratireducens]GGA31714.1 hypothetical protein GCM10010981_21060 [Dyella nitratireducens]GLQ42831.1 hypothetical protein GCM10007902_26810 [Dyella nitratireducens]